MPVTAGSYPFLFGLGGKGGGGGKGGSLIVIVFGGGGGGAGTVTSMTLGFFTSILCSFCFLSVHEMAASTTARDKKPVIFFI
ncbi:MAG: hypothetical protein WAR78_07435 [Ferruginibacter sp.]